MDYHVDSDGSELPGGFTILGRLLGELKLELPHLV